MFIFSWIALGSYQILDQVTRAKDIGQRKSHDLATIQRLGWRLSQDFRQVIKRPVKDENGEMRGWLVFEDEDYLIEFTRSGWTNPLQWPRSELQRVAYTIDYHPERDEPGSQYYNDESLYLLRYYWQVLDRALDTEPRVQAILPDVADFRTRFWDSENQEWSDAPVPGIGGASQVPRAFEVSVVLENEQVLNYIFRVL